MIALDRVYKIYIMSDLHHDNKQVAFDYKQPEDSKDCGLIVAGDIANYSSQTHNMIFDYLGSQYKWVLFVMGNHDYWGTDLEYTIENTPANVYHLGKGNVFRIKNRYIMGDTLWTDFGCNIQNMMMAETGMADYRYITEINTMTIFNTHKEQLAQLESNLAKHKKDTIVVSHHAPSYKSVTLKYVGNGLNSSFVNDLDKFILKHKQIKYWIYGHTHDKVDYKIGKCRVIANPCGYRTETMANHGSTENYYLSLPSIEV